MVLKNFRDSFNVGNIDLGDEGSTNLIPSVLPAFPSIAGTPAFSVNQAAGTTASASPTHAVFVTNGGMTFQLIFDGAAPAAGTAKAAFEAGIQQAASILSSVIADAITVNLNIHYSGTGGGASAGPDNGLNEPYSTVYADLKNHAKPGDTTFNSLPNISTIQGQSQVAVWNAELKVLGLMNPNDTASDDGTANFATDINPNLLVGVALHELTHALGRVPFGSAPDIFDLFRYTGVGTRLFTGGATASPAYFSLDGGVTKRADFGQTSDSSDFINTGVQGANDPFNEFYTSGTNQGLSAVDKQLLDALGYNITMPATATTVIESVGSTKLDQVGSNFDLDPVSGGSGPQLKYQGAAVVAGQFGAWTPIGGEVTSSGYEVAWKIAGTDQYIVWNTDSSGNYVSNTGVVSGTSSTLVSIETSFHQDLNGDGVIGPPAATTTRVIEAFGSTKLDQVGSNFDLDPVSGGSGPQLKYQGAAVVVGQFGAWTPIGGEVTSSGYEIAWKIAGTDQYIVWNTDTSGNYVSDTGVASGTSSTLESIETSFHQDLNGDGMIGPPTTTVATKVIEAFGSTKLDQVGNNFYLDAVGGGSGPQLKYQGAAVVAGQFGAWTPIGGEATASGYEVAWKIVGTDQYIVWNTDSSGNYLSNTGILLGTSNALILLEASFKQDLNGSGTIGKVVPGPAIPQSALTEFDKGVRDTFVFRADLGAENQLNWGNFDGPEFAQISAIEAGGRSNALSNDMQFGLGKFDGSSDDQNHQNTYLHHVDSYSGHFITG